MYYLVTNLCSYLLYRVPDANTDYLNNIDNLFQTCLSIYNEIIIVGDFNLDISKASNSKKINDFAKSCSLQQLIHDYTRITDKTKTIIDLVFVSRSETITESGVHSLGLSDHSLIYLVRKYKQLKHPPRVTKSPSYLSILTPLIFSLHLIETGGRYISITYNNDLIERVDNFKYLGVIFDSQMTWPSHINHVTSKVSKCCGVLNRLKYYLPNCTLKMLAEAMIIPNFDYCSPVWSNCNNELKSRLQKQQNKLARIILSVDIRTPVNDTMTSLIGSN